MMGTVKYLSDRKAIESALRQSQDELKLITEVFPQQVWTALPNWTLGKKRSRKTTV